MKKQSTLFRGIYEFEDDTGAFLAAKIPFQGSADLYADTAINVRPNQRALFVYKGKIVDILKPGLHEVSTENVPILTKLASWKWGGRSPLRAEIWFFTGNKHLGKKFGTSKPVLSKFDGVGVIPIRAFGNYNLRLISPKKFYATLIGSRNSYNITELEDFIQGQLQELLPEALDDIKDIQSLSKEQDKVSQKLEALGKNIFKKYGIGVSDIQIKSLLPAKEIVEALESKVAMSLLGDPKKYMLYKAANSLEAMEESGEGDATQLMMAMMLGRGMNMMEPPESNQASLYAPGNRGARGGFCTHCGAAVEKSHKFCSQCGGKQ